MKRTLLILLVILSVSELAAQGNFRFGLNFSPNVGWIKPSDNALDKGANKFGYAFGLSAEFGLGTGENYSILSGVAVQNLNGEVSATEGNASAEFDVRYIELPFVLKLRTNEIGYLTYFGKFGLSNGVFIGAQSEISDGTTSVSDKTYKGIIPVRSALLFGIGAEYNLSGNTNLVVGLDFNNGFTGIFKKSEDFNDGKAINNAITLNLGVIF